MASVPPPPDPYAREFKRSTFALGIGVGVLAALLLVAGGMFALARFGPKSNPSLAAAGFSSGVTAKPSGPSTPVLPAQSQNESITPKPADIKMHDDIYAWLEHLRITEERRKQISTDQMGDLMITLTQIQSGGAIMDALGSIFGDDPENAPVDIPENKVNRVKETAEQKRQEWKDLQAFFLSVDAPAECAAIQASYSQCLGETGGMMMEILDAVATADQDPQAAIGALTRMQGQSTARIDTLARQTDEQVQEICDQYHTRKWFRIETDYGGGVLGKLPGF